MINERKVISRTEIVLADNILANIINEKLIYSNEHLELYEITKDKYYLQKADEYIKQVEILTLARKILLQTLEEKIKG